MKICANNLNIIVPCQQRLKRLDTFHRTVYHRGGNMQALTWFLQAVKANKAVRHTFTDENWTLEYDLDNNDLDRLVITRRATGREITMSLSTAYKLLDALTGTIERLVRE